MLFRPAPHPLLSCQMCVPFISLPFYAEILKVSITVNQSILLIFSPISGVAPLNLVATRNKKTTGVLFMYFIRCGVKHFLNKQNSASMDILFTNCHSRSPGGKPNLSRLNKSFHKSARLESSSVISSGCLELISKLLIHAGAETK